MLNQPLPVYAQTCHDGDLNGDGVVDVVDALLAVRITLGLITPTANQLVHGDVAPSVNGVPAPDGVIDVADVQIIKRKVLQAGQTVWCFEDQFQRADGIPNGSNATSISDTGQAWASFTAASLKDGTEPGIYGGVLSERNGGANDAGEAIVDLGFVPGIIVTEFSIDSPVDEVINVSQPWFAPITSSTDQGFGTYAHPIIYRDHIAFSVRWPLNGPITAIDSCTHYYAKLLQPGVRYTVKVVYNHNDVEITGPDGVVVRGTHPDISRANGHYLNVQLNYWDADNTGPINIHRINVEPLLW